MRKRLLGGAAGAQASRGHWHFEHPHSYKTTNNAFNGAPLEDVE